MKRILLVAISAILLTGLLSFDRGEKGRVLVFYKTSGYYHQVIPQGVASIALICAKNKIACDATADSTRFNERDLRAYDAVIFLNTTGNVLDENGKKAMQQFIRSGKGFVGIHSASDTEYGWPWYNELVGAYFKNHPEQQIATVRVHDKTFPATSHLPEEWSMKEEWYNFRNTYWDKVNVLLTLDEKTMKGGGNGDFHPLAWYRDFDGGRSFYTAIGHRDETFADTAYQRHLLGGILYAIGNKTSKN